jgi:hypothetical protein
MYYHFTRPHFDRQVRCKIMLKQPNFFFPTFDYFTTMITQKKTPYESQWNEMIHNYTNTKIRNKTVLSDKVLYDMYVYMLRLYIQVKTKF